jgi:hypothetical protein
MGVRVVADLHGAHHRLEAVRDRTGSRDLAGIHGQHHLRSERAGQVDGRNVGVGAVRQDAVAFGSGRQDPRESRAGVDGGGRWSVTERDARTGAKIRRADDHGNSPLFEVAGPHELSDRRPADRRHVLRSSPPADHTPCCLRVIQRASDQRGVSPFRLSERARLWKSREVDRQERVVPVFA